jgi:hypothetical protein
VPVTDLMPARVPFPFFVGAGRSGTTLVKAIFDSHSDMAVPGESGFIVRFGRLPRRRRYETPHGFNVDNLIRDLLDHRGFSRWGLDESEIRADLAGLPPSDFAAAARRLFGLYARKQGKARFGDKTPNYVLNLPLLAELFEEARFIHIIRDGRDVALSHLDIKEWGPSTLEEAAMEWKRHVAAGIAAGARLGPTKYREVGYEDLVADPQRVVSELCVFLDLTYEEGMLNYFERASEVMKPEHHPHHHQHIYAPPTRALRDWRTQMSRAQVRLFEALAGDELDALGYEREAGMPSRRTRFVAQSHVLSSHAGRTLARVRRLPRKVIDARQRVALIRGLADRVRRSDRKVTSAGMGTPDGPS